MNWRIDIADQAKKQLHRLPAYDSAHIERAIDGMEENPFMGDIARLSGQDGVWRRRIGAYRMLYELKADKKLIYIFEIKRRASNTY